MEYRVAKSPRELPCCGKLIRVKIKEPGVQKRHCPRHDTTHYFELHAHNPESTVLFFRWTTEERYKEWIATGSGHNPDEIAEVRLP